MKFRRRLEALGAIRGRPSLGSIELMHGERGPLVVHPDWLFELKYDGYRLLAAVTSSGGVRLQYRRGSDATAAWPEVVEALSRLKLADVILDGELVVLDPAGRPAFNLVQHRFGMSRPAMVKEAALAAPAVLCVFDLLALGDLDLRGVPLRERKETLRELFAEKRPGSVMYVDHVSDGAKLFCAARALGAEGVMAKRATSLYRGGRSYDWRKTRADLTSDFVVVGYTAPGAGVGALHLAGYAGPVLAYVGEVHAGFPRGMLGKIAKELKSIARAKPACVGVRGLEAEVWVEPRVVCEVAYLEITEAGVLRHASFARFRPDKSAGECALPPGAGAGIEGRPAAAPSGRWRKRR